MNKPLQMLVLHRSMRKVTRAGFIPRYSRQTALGTLQNY